MDSRVYVVVALYLCFLLGGDSYIEQSSVLIDSLARDLSTNFNPLLRTHAPWYVHYLQWIYLSFATACPMKKPL